MFDQSIQRIGFCCKYLEADQTLPKKILEEAQRPFNTRSTTITWLNRQDKDVAEQRLWDLMVHNIQSFYRLVEYTGSLIPQRRMVRLGSDCLPAFTEKDWSYYWQKPDVQAYCEKELIKVGDLARKLDVKLSFHPGQFCVLASDNPDVVERSIEEFEYHVNMARWMGYGKEFQDFKCNVHISGRKGYQGIIDVMPRLTPEARNVITIENDEMCHGLDQSLHLEKHLALVLDIHHHWIRDEEYIQANDDRVKRVIDSWRGVRPTLHYSYSRDEWLDQSSRIDEGTRHNSLHSIPELLDTGAKKQKLRAHSDLYPNSRANDWALSFWDKFDIQCEAKAKNIASEQLYVQAVENNLCQST